MLRGISSCSEAWTMDDVVFSNSEMRIWRAIQEAIGTAGFVVADVRTLDKQQGSYRQVTSTAVKQDLVISAYKPTEALTERFRLGRQPRLKTHGPLLRSISATSQSFLAAMVLAEVVAERTAQVLHDRMVAFHVQRQLSVPLSTGEFLAGLSQRYPERDGMYFLSDAGRGIRSQAQHCCRATPTQPLRDR